MGFLKGSLFIYLKLNCEGGPYFNSGLMVYLAIGDLKSPISAVLAGIF